VETTTRRTGAEPPRQTSAAEDAVARLDGRPADRTARTLELGRATVVLTQIARARSRVPAWSSRLVFLLGLVNIASAVLPRRRSMLAWSIGLLPPMGMATVSVLGVAVGFGLLMMARGLRHRKRRAWRAVVGLLSVGITVHLLRGIDPVQTLISGAVTAVLVASRNQFIGLGDPRSRRSVPVVFVSITTACWLLGCFVTQADRDNLVPGWTWSLLAKHAAMGLVGVAGPIAFTSRTAADNNLVMLFGLGITTAVVTLLALLRSSGQVESATAEQRAAVRALLAAHGEVDSLGYFATRDDKSVIFSASGKAAVAYRVVSGVCLAAGDPLGDVEAWPAAIEAWLRLAQRRAWVPSRRPGRAGDRRRSHPRRPRVQPRGPADA
jgi:lysyl-tRNA synthetase class 2